MSIRYATEADVKEISELVMSSVIPHKEVEHTRTTPDVPLTCSRFKTLMSG